LFSLTVFSLSFYFYFYPNPNPSIQSILFFLLSSYIKSNSVEIVERAARALDLLEDIEIIKGFFNESLPRALSEGIIGTSSTSSSGTTATTSGGGSGGELDVNFFSMIRLDGDLYQSTIESLHYLYPLLSVGGYVVVDDFTDWKVCVCFN
jgi:hypothetical protein